eukprot:6203367-Pleurochrysis_carterae.AAC.2
MAAAESLGLAAADFAAAENGRLSLVEEDVQRKKRRRHGWRHQRAQTNLGRQRHAETVIDTARNDHCFMQSAVSHTHPGHDRTLSISLPIRMPCTPYVRAHVDVCTHGRGSDCWVELQRHAQACAATRICSQMAGLNTYNADSPRRACSGRTAMSETVRHTPRAPSAAHLTPLAAASFTRAAASAERVQGALSRTRRGEQPAHARDARVDPRDVGGDGYGGARRRYRPLRHRQERARTGR